MSSPHGESALAERGRVAVSESLFRSEAVQARRAPLCGDVILAQPRALPLLVLLALVVCAGVGSFLVWGDYARKETVRGYLVPEQESGLPDGRLRAELFVPMRTMGFVEVGQPVRLHFDAFPFRRFGTYAGEVVELGEVVQRPKELSPLVMREESPYRVSVRLAEQEISVFGKKVPLRSGMLLEAELILERRSLLGWLLEPLHALRRGV